jgi:hypothetical protein
MTAKLSRCSRRCWDCRSLKITLPNPSGSGLILFIRRLAAREAIFCWNDIHPRQSVDAISERPRRLSRTGASSFLAKQLNLGLVGYHLQQITDDHGAPERSSEGLNRASPGQVGRSTISFRPATKIQGYATVKMCKEFVGESRAEGWNACGCRSRFYPHQ